MRGDRPELIEMMSHDDDGGASREPVGEEIPHPLGRFDVEPGHRFIEQQEVGSMMQCPRDGNALRGSPTESANLHIETALQAERSHHGIDECAGASEKIGREVKVFSDRQVAVELGLMTHHADALPNRRIGPNGGSGEGDRATTGPNQAGQNPEQRGFTDTVVTQNDVTLAGFGSEMESRQNRPPPVAMVEVVGL